MWTPDRRRMSRAAPTTPEVSHKVETHSLHVSVAEPGVDWSKVSASPSSRVDATVPPRPARGGCALTLSPDLVEDHTLPTDDRGAARRSTSRSRASSPTQIALGRLRRDPIAMICFVIVIFFTLVASLRGAVVRPLRCLHRHRPATANGRPGHRTPAGRPAQPRLRPRPPVRGGAGRRATTTSPTGSTGCRTSLFLACLATFVSILIGVTLGLVAGFVGGLADGVISFFTDLFLTLPFLVVALAIAPIIADRFGTNIELYNKLTFWTLVVILVVFGWMGMARLIRGEVLSLREREFVKAARVMGVPTRRILVREILPNLVAPIVVSISLSLPAFVAAEAGLSYLGIGVQGRPSWGQTIDRRHQVLGDLPALPLGARDRDRRSSASRSTCSATRSGTQSTRRPGAERPHTSATRFACPRQNKERLDTHETQEGVRRRRKRGGTDPWSRGVRGQFGRRRQRKRRLHRFHRRLRSSAGDKTPTRKVPPPRSRARRPVARSPSSLRTRTTGPPASTPRPLVGDQQRDCPGPAVPLRSRSSANDQRRVSTCWSPTSRPTWGRRTPTSPSGASRIKDGIKWETAPRSPLTRSPSASSAPSTRTTSRPVPGRRTRTRTSSVVTSTRVPTPAVRTSQACHGRGQRRHPQDGQAVRRDGLLRHLPGHRPGAARLRRRRRTTVSRPLATGPYKIEKYVPNQELVLVKNDQWDPDSDPSRTAYPDKLRVQGRPPVRADRPDPAERLR